MFNKILLSSIMSLLLLSGAVFAEEQNIFGGTSITDFTIHKVIPQKSPAKPTTVVEQVKTIETKPETKVEAKKTPAPVKKIVKSQSKSTPVKPMPMLKPEPKPEPIKLEPQTVTKVVETKPEEQKVHKPEPIEPVQEKTSKNESQKTGFDEDDFTKRLNDYLDQDPSENGSVKIVDEELKSYDYIVRPSVSLGIVILLILVFAWVYAKIKGIQPNIGFPGKSGGVDLNKFKVLATSTLGQGKVIHLVEINGKQLVVGSTNNNINMLTEISPEDMENLQNKAQQNNNKKSPPIQDKPQNKPPVQEEEEIDYYNQESYSARYSELYKEYIDKDKD